MEGIHPVVCVSLVGEAGKFLDDSLFCNSLELVLVWLQRFCTL